MSSTKVICISAPPRRVIIAFDSSSKSCMLAMEALAGYVDSGDITRWEFNQVADSSIFSFDKHQKNLLVLYKLPRRWFRRKEYSNWAAEVTPATGNKVIELLLGKRDPISARLITKLLFTPLSAPI